jgi:hypothetical protein
MPHHQNTAETHTTKTQKILYNSDKSKILKHYYNKLK